MNTAARISAATALLAALIFLALAETAFAAGGTAEATGLGSSAQIRQFQRAHGLQADGIAGPDTLFAVQAVPRGHVREVQPAPGRAVSLASPPAPLRAHHHGGIGYLFMFLAGVSILVGLAVWKLREPVLFRVRMLRDSFGPTPAGYSPPGVRWVEDEEMFAEGRAARGGIGRFRGSVAAVTELRGERCFLVRDPTRPRGVWVFESEIRDLVEG